MHDITQILNAAANGDVEVANELLPLIYDELRKLASQKLAREKPGHTLQPTALVHEAYMRLLGGTPGGATDAAHWDNVGHFFGAAAEAMRRILVESARRRSRAKHGGGQKRVDLEDHDIPVRPPPEEILALDEALTKLAEEDAVAAQVVQLHFFGGLSIEQTADSLKMSRATAYRHWTYARAWLRVAIGGEGNLPSW